MELDMFFKRNCLVVALLIGLFSCEKAADRSCFKSTGTETTKVIALPSFELLELYEHMEFVLIQDSTNQLVLKGGENLLNHIHWQVDGGVLKIENKNRCNFLRKLDQKVKVEIHFTSLINILYQGTEPMTNQDTLHVPYFTLLLRDGAGSVRLCLRSEIVQADISHGWGDYTLSGNANYASIAVRSNGYCDTYDLKVRDSIFVSHASPGKVKVSADQIPLRANILGDGDIYYKGVPSSITISKFPLANGTLVPQ